MSSGKRITVVAPKLMDHLIAQARAPLEAEGHSVVRYLGVDQFVADEGGLAATDVIIAPGQVKITREMIAAAPKLRAIVSPITGIDGFDDAAAAEFGVLIANGQIPENYISMAEGTVMLILAALYDLNGTQRVLRENLPRPEHLTARMLFKKTVGLIGFGQISRSVAERLQGFQCEMITYVRSPRDLPGYVTAVPLDDLLKRSDIVVVLTSLNPETRHLLGADKLALMKPDVVFVNTARGPIVDEAALIDLVRQRPGMRLGLDVFEVEPLPLDSPLRDIPDAVLTPHMAGHTVETHDLLPLVAAQNCSLLLKGELPLYVCNPSVVDRWKARFGA